MSELASPAPRLSVVIVVGDEGTRHGLERTMQSLRSQASFPRMGVILIDCSIPGTPPLQGEEINRFNLF